MKRKIQSINGLKGLSCLIIMIYHYRFYLLDLGLDFIDYGYYFVEVFMTISGFLMAYNYKNQIPEMSLRTYFIRRYLKIMPMFWITEILMHLSALAAEVFSGEKLIFNVGEELLRYSGMGVFLFGQGIYPRNNPLWTISSLLFCYLLYYLITRMCGNNKKRYLCACIAVLSVFTWIYFMGACKGKFSVNINVCLSMMSFYVGVLLFEVYTGCRDKKQTVSKIFTAAAVLSGTALIMENIFQKDCSVLTVDLYIVFLFCPCISYNCLVPSMLSRIFNTSVFQFLGGISMDLYMWHWVTRVYLGSRPVYIQQETLSGFIVLVIVAIMMAILSHYVIMKQLNRGRNKLKLLLNRNNRGVENE